MRPVPVTFLRFAFSDQLSVMRPCQRLTLGEKLGGKPKIAWLLETYTCGS